MQYHDLAGILTGVACLEVENNNLAKIKNVELSLSNAIFSKMSFSK
jgi:hypothetical protein